MDLLARVRGDWRVFVSGLWSEISIDSGLQILESRGNLFGPAKPSLFNLYLRTERYIHLKLLV